MTYSMLCFSIGILNIIIRCQRQQVFCEIISASGLDWPGLE